MATSGLDYHIRKKLVNQHIVDLAQLGERVRQIEQLRSEKNQKNNKKFVRREKINCVEQEQTDSEDEVIAEQEINLAELKEGPPYAS